MCVVCVVCVCACVYVVCVCPVNPRVQELVHLHELLVGQRVDQERGQILGHGDNPELDSGLGVGYRAVRRELWAGVGAPRRRHTKHHTTHICRALSDTLTYDASLWQPGVHISPR